jgi:hypothetical protein
VERLARRVDQGHAALRQEKPHRPLHPIEPGRDPFPCARSPRASPTLGRARADAAPGRSSPALNTPPTTRS